MRSPLPKCSQVITSRSRCLYQHNPSICGVLRENRTAPMPRRRRRRGSTRPLWCSNCSWVSRNTQPISTMPLPRHSAVMTSRGWRCWRQWRSSSVNDFNETVGVRLHGPTALNKRVALVLQLELPCLDCERKHVWLGYKHMLLQFSMSL